MKDSRPYRYLVENDVTPPPTPAFAEAEGHKEAAKMMRIWKKEIDSMALSHRNITCDDIKDKDLFGYNLQDRVKEKVAEFRNSQLWKDYCALPGPKSIKLSYKKVKSEGMLDKRISRCQEEIQRILATQRRSQANDFFPQMDLPKPVGPSKRSPLL